MRKVTEVKLAALAGGVGAAACFVPVKPVALAAAALVVIGLPAWAAGRFRCAHDATADGAEFVAAAFGGLAVSCLALWACGALWGLSRLGVILAPMAVALLLVAGASPLRRSPAKGGMPPGYASWLALLAGSFAILVLVPFLPYGWDRADGVHRMGLSDWYLHFLTANALDTANALPPANPCLYSSKISHYHYGFHLVAAAIHRAAGRQGDIFSVLLGLTVATAAAFPVVSFVVARGLLGDQTKALIAAAAATLLAGFDLVVWAVRGAAEVVQRWPLGPRGSALRAAMPSAHLDFWADHNERQFNAPYTAVIWAPHYVAAVLSTLLIIHLLRGDPTTALRKGWRDWLLPALLLASLPALSIYVALATVAGVVGVAILDLPSASWRPWRSPTVRRWAPAGGASFVAALPVIMSLRQSVGQHLSPLTLHVSSAGTWHNGAIFTFLRGDSWWTHLLDTPALYFFEFGIVGVLGFAELTVRFRKRRWTAHQREAARWILSLMIFLTFVRPPVGGPNNLNFRPMLIVWSLLSVFAVEAWWRLARRGWVAWGGVALCAAGTVYAAAGATLEGALFWATPRELVAVSRWIDEHTAPEAIVAVDPDHNSRSLGYWLRRRVVMGDHRRDAIMVGASAEELASIEQRLREAFASPGAEQAAERFRGLEADVIFIEVEAGHSPSWAAPPCFRLGYSAPPYAVFLLECVASGSRAEG